MRGSKIWVLVKHDIKRLNVFERGILREKLKKIVNGDRLHNKEFNIIKIRNNCRHKHNKITLR